MKKTSTYFENLFNSLCEKDKQENKYIQLDGDTLQSPEQLKEYMFNIIKSNMQYDFGIDFDDNDVIKFMTASMSDYINSKDYKTMNVVNCNEIDDYALSRLSDAYTARTSLYNLDDINLYTVEELANVCELANQAWMKDENFYSKDSIFDVIAQMMNEGIKVAEMMKKPIRELLSDIYDRMPA